MSNTTDIMATPPSPGQSFKGYIDTKGFSRFHLQFKSYELPLYDVAVVVSSFSPFVIKDYQMFSKQQQKTNSIGQDKSESCKAHPTRENFNPGKFELIRNLKQP